MSWAYDSIIMIAYDIFLFETCSNVEISDLIKFSSNNLTNACGCSDREFNLD